ncbi:MAG: tyrosine-type recombinase/integrase [Desulfobacteria bacterium]
MKKKNPFSPTRTKYPGVYYILGTNSRGKAQRILYVSYRREGKQHFEKVGVEGFMIGDPPVKLSPAVADTVRSLRIRGLELPNRERREAERAAKAAFDSRWIIGKLAEEYFTHRERQKTVQVDRNLYKRSLEDEFKDKTPEEIDPLSLDRFKKKLSQRKNLKDEKKSISPTSVRNALALLRQIVNHGMERQLTKGFSGKVPVPRVAGKLKGDDLSPAHLSALLTALDADTDQAAADVVRLALYTGARREEILRLRWPDVDLTRGLWKLVDRKAGGDTGFPLSAPALAVLKKRHDVRPLDEKGEEVSKFVFPGTGEKYGYLRDPRAAFERIKAAAGLPATFRILHGCRHHFASMMVAEGVDLLTVARLLGHADAQMVMRRYAHIRPGVLSAAAELSGNLINATVANARKEQEMKHGKI